jgi:ribose/xylose/arabinose/galactoside ABC-type transport system permease subunit
MSRFFIPFDWRGHARASGIGVALAIAIGILAVFSPRYLTLDNFMVVALQVSFIGLASVGTAGLIMSGNIDLSIGSLFALTSVCAALVAKIAPPFAAILAAIALGGLIGLGNGALVWRMKLSPIIITLGSMAILRGAVLLLTGGYAVRGVPKDFSGFGQAHCLGMPMPVCALLLMALASQFVLARTTIGRHLLAIGGNRAAAVAAGIPVRRLTLGMFLVNGCIVGFSGALAASRYGSASPAFGVGLELDAITAVILGGVAFTGGEGNIPGVMLAVALLGVINSGIVSLGIDPHWSEIFKGAVLIMAVCCDQLAQEARSRYRKRMAMKEPRSPCAADLPGAAPQPLRDSERRIL